MKRTFKSKIDKIRLVGGLLPMFFFACYFFWAKQSVAGLISIMLVVFQLEYILHTYYELLDSGELNLCFGRFARSKKYKIEDIDKIEIHAAKHFLFFKQDNCVMLTLKNGKSLLLIPEVPEEFCRAVLKKQALLKSKVDEQ